MSAIHRPAARCRSAVVQHGAGPDVHLLQRRLVFAVGAASPVPMAAAGGDFSALGTGIGLAANTWTTLTNSTLISGNTGGWLQRWTLHAAGWPLSSVGFAFWLLTAGSLTIQLKFRRTAPTLAAHLLLLPLLLIFGGKSIRMLLLMPTEADCLMFRETSTRQIQQPVHHSPPSRSPASRDRRVIRVRLVCPARQALTVHREQRAVSSSTICRAASSRGAQHELLVLPPGSSPTLPTA